jgi:hypothetical protein
MDPGGWSVIPFMLIIVVLAMVAGWLYRRQQREHGQRLRLEDQLRRAEERRTQADQALADGKKAADALRESEARYRALAVRMSRRHALTAALSQAVTTDAVAKAVVHEGRTLLGAQGGAVMRLVENRTKLVRLHSMTTRSGNGSSSMICRTWKVSEYWPLMMTLTPGKSSSASSPVARRLW